MAEAVAEELERFGGLTTQYRWEGAAGSSLSGQVGWWPLSSHVPLVA